MSRRLMLWMAVVVLSILVSGVGVVWARHQSRALFVELQKQRAQYELANMDWGRLQLELANVGGLEDVMRLASQRLHMQAPAPDSIVMVE